MILENIASSLLASVLALTSVGGTVDSLKSAVPRAEAQVRQSAQADEDRHAGAGQGDQGGEDTAGVERHREALPTAPVALSDALIVKST